MLKEQDSFIMMKRFYLNFEKNANKILKDKDLRLSQVYVLMLLFYCYNGECEYKQIEKRLNIAQSSTVALVNKLDQKGYLELCVSEKDKRVKKMRLTEKGKDACRWVDTQLEARMSHMYDGLTEIEKQVFFMLLDKIGNNLAVD